MFACPWPRCRESPRRTRRPCARPDVQAARTAGCRPTGRADLDRQDREVQVGVEVVEHVAVRPLSGQPLQLHLEVLDALDCLRAASAPDHMVSGGHVEPIRSGAEDDARADHRLARHRAADHHDELVGLLLRVGLAWPQRLRAGLRGLRGSGRPRPRPRWPREPERGRRICGRRRFRLASWHLKPSNDGETDSEQIHSGPPEQ